MNKQDENFIDACIDEFVDIQKHLENTNDEIRQNELINYYSGILKALIIFTYQKELKGDQSVFHYISSCLFTWDIEICKTWEDEYQEYKRGR